VRNLGNSVEITTSKEFATSSLQAVNKDDPFRTERERCNFGANRRVVFDDTETGETFVYWANYSALSFLDHF
jgi:hypothetical protein